MIADGRLAIPEPLAELVTDDAYARLLGYPSGAIPDGPVAARAREARDWFERQARPWAWVRILPIARASTDKLTLQAGPTLTSERLAALLEAMHADRLVIALATSGEQVDAEAAERWRQDRPDEAFLLDRFGAAAAIRLGAWVGEHLRATANAADLGLGPGYSPGYDGWDLTDQVDLAACLGGPGSEPTAALPGPLRVLPSGMIEPKSSLLAVFGLSSRRAAAERLWLRHPCSWCSMAGCTLRGRQSKPPALGP